MIFFIVGVSGAGKSTLIKNLKEHFRGDDRVVFVPSFSTREMRKGEKQGDPYFFISKDEFKRKIAGGDFLERAVVHGKHFYGTDKQSVLKPLEEGKIVIKELDMNWLLWLLQKNEIPGKFKTIFLDLPIKEIKNRILQRQPDISMEELESRVQSWMEEKVLGQKLVDFMIDASVPPQKVLEEVLKIIEPYLNK